MGKILNAVSWLRDGFSPTNTSEITGRVCMWVRMWVRMCFYPTLHFLVLIRTAVIE